MYAPLITPKRGGLSAEYLKQESEKKQKVTFFQGLILNVIPLLTRSKLFSYSQNFYVGYSVNLPECNDE